MKRTFEYKDEKSSKFWSIESNDNAFTVTYGKIGITGQTQTKTFANEEACVKELEKLIREKTKKGYVEQGSDSIQSPTSTPKASSTDPDEIFELASGNDKYLPLFVDYHRKVRPGGGMEQLGQIADLMSNTDNGIRLLAACCVYAIDNEHIEFNIEPWVEESLEDINPKKLPKLSSVSTGTKPKDKSSLEEPKELPAIELPQGEWTKNNVTKVIEHCIQTGDYSILTSTEAVKFFSVEGNVDTFLNYHTQITYFDEYVDKEDYGTRIKKLVAAIKDYLPKATVDELVEAIMTLPEMPDCEGIEKQLNPPEIKPLTGQPFILEIKNSALKYLPNLR